MARLWVVALVLAMGLAPSGSAAEEARAFAFTCESVIGPLPDTGEPVHVFVPLPRDGPVEKRFAYEALGAGADLAGRPEPSGSDS